MKRYQRGMSLLELLLVFGIVTVIMVTALRFMRLQEYERDISNLKQQVETILLLMNEYYYGPAKVAPGVASMPNCRNVSDKQFDPNAGIGAVTLSDMLAWAADNSTLSAQQLALITSPGNFGQAQQIKFVLTPLDPAMKISLHYSVSFQIKISFPGDMPMAKLQIIQGRLAADPVISNHTLTWTRMPGQTIDKTGLSSLWVSSAHLQAKVNASDISNSMACPI